MVSNQGLSELLAAVEDAEYIDVRDAAHMIVGDANDAFSRAILGFCEKHICSQDGIAHEVSKL